MNIAPEFRQKRDELWLSDVPRAVVVLGQSAVLVFAGRYWITLLPALAVRYSPGPNWQTGAPFMRLRKPVLNGDTVTTWPILDATLIHLERMSHRGWHLNAWRGEQQLACLALWVGKDKAKIEDYGCDTTPTAKE